MKIISEITKELKLALPYKITWLLVASLITTSVSLFCWLLPSEQVIKGKLVQILIGGSLGLFWISLGLALSLLILYKRSKKNQIHDKFIDYKFNPISGSWINKNDKMDRACAKCKISGIFSPLHFSEKMNLFVCPNCSQKTKIHPLMAIVPDGENISVIENGRE